MAEEVGMERKTNVLDKVAEGKQWGLLAACQGTDPDGWVQRIRGSLLTAAIRHADEDAVAHAGWLMQAVAEADAAANPLPDRKTDWQTHDRAQREGRVRVAMAQAREAKELFAGLPAYRDGWISEFVDQDETRPAPHKYPALVKTRKALLAEVGKGWCAADREEDADAFLDTVLAAVQSDGYPEYRAAAEEALREVLKSASRPKLLRALQRHPEAEMVAHAWVRQAAKSYGETPNSSGRLIGAVGCLHENSPPAAAFLEVFAEELCELDRKLREAVGRRPEVGIEYVSLSEVVVRLVVKQVYGSDENGFHAFYEKLRDSLREAKKCWSRSVRLRLEGKLLHPYEVGVVKAERSDSL